MKCSVCGKEYERNVRVLRTDRVTGTEYMVCPVDQGICYEKPAEVKKTPKKRAPKAKKENTEQEKVAEDKES